MMVDKRINTRLLKANLTDILTVYVLDFRLDINVRYQYIMAALAVNAKMIF